MLMFYGGYGGVERCTHKTCPVNKALVFGLSPWLRVVCRGQASEGVGMGGGAQLLEEASLGRGCREASDCLTPSLPARLPCVMASPASVGELPDVYFW